MGWGMKRVWAGCLLLLGLMVSVPGLAAAPPPEDTAAAIKVGTRQVKPFVFEVDGKLSGFSVDLWEQIASALNLKTEFDVHGPLPELLDGIRSGKDQAAIAAISITAEREGFSDFSQPMFDSGLTILVPASGTSGVLDRLAPIFGSTTFMVFLGIFLVMVLVPGHIIWYAERGCESYVPLSTSYFPGIFQATFWAACMLGGQPEGFPSRPISRVIVLLKVYVGLIFTSLLTAYIASSMTVQQLKTEISGPADLPGRTIATIKGSTAAAYLRSVGANVVDAADLERAVAAVERRDAQAVVYDSPLLLYYAAHEGNGHYRIAGETFRRENYGIMFPHDSALRKRVDQVLLKLRENGSYQQIYQKWFGGTS